MYSGIRTDKFDKLSMTGKEAKKMDALEFFLTYRVPQQVLKKIVKFCLQKL